MKSIGWMLLGAAVGVAAVVIYQKIVSHEGAPDIEALDERVSLHLNELENRVAELAS